MVDVSIIIPTYNRLWSLPKAISSCREQGPTTEVIVIDDGSTDGTWEWLQQQQDLTLLRQDNQGKDWAVNKGFALATGKYVRFLDSDDWLLSGSTKALFEAAERGELDVTCAGYQVFTEDEQLIKEIQWTVCDDFLAQQLGECDSSHYSAYLFRKSFIEDIPHRQEFAALDDRQFIIEVALKLPKIGYVQQSTFAHRAHGRQRLQNASGLTEAASHLAQLNIYKKCFEKLEQEGRLTQRYKSAASNKLWHLAHWIAKTDINTGREVYNWLYQLSPAFIPGENRGIARMYKLMGFAATERLLTIRRLLNAR
ncbi:glycosyltransferase family 2 protein [Mucilaginibacter terrenus]|uniref:Glycosyltransferase family 2 protein n=1 Tax=Mucilaginibacter terrenus TaxID=2482727 RepID=A0A3E2NMW8_9SPHI|nr:glycosyltransferase family 2 protein [Mucilaginibacter terrenus]RFZ82240.1 glycosyltransferase family 2 protein [Mucilaginibacter terrenus]